jgi:hypothetical protein
MEKGSTGMLARAVGATRLTNAGLNGKRVTLGAGEEVVSEGAYNAPYQDYGTVLVDGYRYRVAMADLVIRP